MSTKLYDYDAEMLFMLSQVHKAVAASMERVRLHLVDNNPAYLDTELGACALTHIFSVANMLNTSLHPEKLAVALDQACYLFNDLMELQAGYTTRTEDLDEKKARVQQARDMLAEEAKKTGVAVDVLPQSSSSSSDKPN